MRSIPLSIPDVRLVEAPVHRDDRGFFTEVFHAAKFAALDIPTSFVQDNHSRSGQHVLRGLHYQVPTPQGKLVGVLRGRVFDVAVDVRRSSPTFGNWVGVELEEASGRLLWIPPGFAHGFLVLSATADVTYKCTAPYDPSGGRCLRWNDPALGIDWPLPEGVHPTLSAQDEAAPALDDVEAYP